MPRYLVETLLARGDASAECSGSGYPVGARRFNRFRCRVISKSLEIPPAIAIEGAGIALDGEPRTLGPVNAELDGLRPAARANGARFTARPLQRSRRAADDGLDRARNRDR
jgi:hypothetical protein